MTEHVRAELRRSGGFIGRTVHVTVDSATLPPADAAQLLRLVSAIDLDRPAPRRIETRGADLMHYDLTIERGARTWHGMVSDPNIPAELSPLLQFLTRYS
jgi:hypothetical protein